MAKKETRKAACHFCHMNCGILATVENGVITKMVGDPEHPFNLGGQCPRGASALDHLNHPDRINYPLKRVGERGSGKFVRVTWDEALTDIALRLTEIKEKYGAEGLCTLGGTNRTDDFARRRFFNIWGSPNVSHTANICWIPNFLNETSGYGWGAFDPEAATSKLVIVWGHNSGSSYIPELRTYLEAKEKNGTTFIVVDPIYTDTAAKADLWLPIRPGSDNALALAMLNVIIKENLYDKKFVEEFTYGFDQVKERVQQYTPEWAAKECGIEAELIIKAARMYANAKPASYVWGVALDQQGRGSSKGAQARCILRAICGNIDVPGGDVIPGPHPTFTTDWELELNDMLPEEQRAKQIGSDRFKLQTWPGYKYMSDNLVEVWGKSIPAEWFCESTPAMLMRAMAEEKPYPVKACIILADNPLVAYPNSKLVFKALMNQEFIVAMEYWMTPSALLADYVLPCASWQERPLMTTTYGVSDWLIASQRACKPLFERITDYEFWRELSIKLGYGEYWPWETDEDMFFARMEKFGLQNYGIEDYDTFVSYVRMNFADRAYEKHKIHKEQGIKPFATTTGKIELYNKTFEHLGYDPLPAYVERPFKPSEEYPYYLIAGGGFMPYFHSEHREITRLRLLKPYPHCMINSRVAAEKGIKNEDWVWIETPIGRIKQRAFCTEAISPECIQVERGWWFPEKGVDTLFGVFESNANVLVDDDPETLDECCGSYCCRGQACKIYKVQEGDRNEDVEELLAMLNGGAK